MNYQPCPACGVITKPPSPDTVDGAVGWCQTCGWGCVCISGFWYNLNLIADEPENKQLLENLRQRRDQWFHERGMFG